MSESDISDITHIPKSKMKRSNFYELQPRNPKRPIR